MHCLYPRIFFCVFFFFHLESFRNLHRIARLIKHSRAYQTSIIPIWKLSYKPPLARNRQLYQSPPFLKSSGSVIRYCLSLNIHDNLRWYSFSKVTAAAYLSHVLWQNHQRARPILHCNASSVIRYSYVVQINTIRKSS